MVVAIMRQMVKMAKAIGDCSFYRRLFTEGAIDRQTAVTELQIVHSYGYEILLPYSVLYCIIGTSFKRNANNPTIFNQLKVKYGLTLVQSEKDWSENIDTLFNHSYGQIATPTLADMEVRTFIKRDSEISFLLSYDKEKYADFFPQIQTF